MGLLGPASTWTSRFTKELRRISAKALGGALGLGSWQEAALQAHPRNSRSQGAGVQPARQAKRESQLPLDSCGGPFTTHQAGGTRTGTHGGHSLRAP